MGAFNSIADLPGIFQGIWGRLSALERTRITPQYPTASLPVASTVEGLIVYDTTAKVMKFSNGTVWTAM